MSSSYGTNLKITLFGESHGAAVGAVLDGLPPGEEIDAVKVQAFLFRRKPGHSRFTSPRREADEVEILSGVYKNKTTGTPLAIVIKNTGAHPADYENLAGIARPAHGDYTAHLRYKGFADPRGGGHASGRLTAPLCACGAIALQILERKGVAIGAHLLGVGPVFDKPFDNTDLTPGQLAAIAEKELPIQSDAAADEIKDILDKLKKDGDSVGGCVECAVLGFPAGIGSPIFGGLENRLSAILFGIPAVKAVAFGDGATAGALYGSQANDPFVIKNGEIVTETNHHGGILGGISTGMPIVFTATFKPTPSIARRQTTVDYIKKEAATITIDGRHDPCIAIRAVPCVEAAAALALLDALLD